MWPPADAARAAAAAAAAAERAAAAAEKQRASAGRWVDRTKQKSGGASAATASAVMDRLLGPRFQCTGCMALYVKRQVCATASCRLVAPAT